MFENLWNNASHAITNAFTAVRHTAGVPGLIVLGLVVVGGFFVLRGVFGRRG